MFNITTRRLKNIAIISLISGSLLVSGQVKADHDSNLLLLAAPVILYSMLHRDHSYTRHTRITSKNYNGHRNHRNHRDDHYKPRRHSHSSGRYSSNKHSDRRGRH